MCVCASEFNELVSVYAKQNQSKMRFTCRSKIGIHSEREWVNDGEHTRVNQMLAWAKWISKKLGEKQASVPPANNSTACSNQLFNQQYYNKRWCLNHRMLHSNSPALFSVVLRSLCMFRTKIVRTRETEAFPLYIASFLFLDSLSGCWTHFPFRFQTIWPAVCGIDIANVLVSLSASKNFFSFRFGSFMLPKSITNSKESERWACGIA